MKKNFVCLIFAAVILAAAASAWPSPVLRELPYQKTCGSLVSNTSYTFKFSFWNEASGGSQQWWEEKKIKLAGYVLKHNLGSVSPFDMNVLTQQLWVQLERRKADGTYVVIGTRDKLSIAAYSLYSVSTSSPITSVQAGTGLTGGGPAGDITLDIGAGPGLMAGADSITIDPNYVQRRVNAACASGYSIRSIDANGNVSCEYDDGITSVTSGSGLQATLSGTALYVSADMNILQRKVASSTAGSFNYTLAAGDNYFYPMNALSLTYVATCMVTVSAQIQSYAANSSTGPFFRVAIKRATTDNNDTLYGHYFPVQNSGYSADLTRSSVVTLNANQATQFGCYFGSVDSNWAGDYASCHVSYACF